MTKYFRRSVLAILFAIVSLAGFSATYSYQTLPKPGRNDATPYVINPDGVITAATETRLNQQLQALADSTGVEFVVIAVESVDGGDIDDFATKVFESWGIGKRGVDNGIVLAVARDDRKYAIRVGKGAEGVLTDVQSARIGRNELVPAFRQGNYDDGILNASAAVAKIVSDPESAAELRAPKTEDEETLDELAEFFRYYLAFSIVVTILLIVVTIIKLTLARKKSSYEKYLSFKVFTSIVGWCSFLLLGLSVVVYVPLRMLLHHWRDGRHNCPNCGTAMNKLPEDRDNDYLNPAQDLEERLNSVDYDVWLCPNCNTHTVYAFKNPLVNFVECDTCHARTSRLVSDNILVHPTRSSEGVGEKVYECLNCGSRSHRRYKIAKESAPAIVILPGGGGGSGSGFGGGGFGGFGGGSTGGGGASGGW